MRSIGEMAHDSGLAVSALRFYDRAGVLVPAWVDPVSGYRWYGPEQLDEARVLAGLRRAGMPVADIRLVLAAWSGTDTGLVSKLLQAHLSRLEEGLSDARDEFSTLRALLEHRENKPMTSSRSGTARLSVTAPALAAALDAVRFAVGTDPELPMLTGILFDIEDGTLRVVATDRYRMAVAHAATTATTRHTGPRVQAVVPAPLADAMRALLGGEESVRLTVADGRVTLEAGDRRTAGQSLDHDFPDYRRLVTLPAGRRAVVDVPAFEEALKTGPVRAGAARAQDGVPCDLSLLKVSADGTVTVCEDGEDNENCVAVNRDFLLQALAAGARGWLVLELGAPTAPVTIRRPEGGGAFSMLMPVRLED